MTALLLLAASLAANPSTPVLDKPTLDAIWAAFSDSPVLVERHRGYLAYLKARPPLEAAESEYWELLDSPGLGRATAAFEEALLASPSGARAYQDYLAALKANPALQEAEEALFRIEANDLLLSKDGGAAMDLLRADLQKARALTEGDDTKTAPAAGLLALHGHLARRPELRQALQIQFRAIGDQEAKIEAVSSWWRMCADAKAVVGASYRALRIAFAKRPSAFAAWRTRARLWAQDAHAFSWARAWLGQVRRNDRLATVYPAYMRLIAQRPEWAASAEQAWRQAAGPSPAWPPTEEPPALTALLAHGVGHSGIVPHKPSVHSTSRPGKPSVPMPQKPTMPRMPSQGGASGR